MHESYSGYRFLLLLVILALNAFFAAAEVALVSSRRSRLQALADHGDVGAIASIKLLSNPGRLLSVTQVCVTLATLLLGWAGEDNLHAFLQVMLGKVIPAATLKAIDIVLYIVTFSVISYFHVVLGEVLPKNLAIEKADRLAVLLAPPLLVVDRIFAPFVFVVERTSSWLTHALGLRGESHAGGHSIEELKFIVSSSRGAGHLLDFEETAISRMLDLQQYSAREIMVPRNQFAAVSVRATLDQVLRVLDEHQYSRLPVYDEGPEQIIGVVHLKDLVRVWLERKAAQDARKPGGQFRLRNLMRKPMFVPETKPLNELIDEFRLNHTHMAMVVDEFGTISGLVTLEDALEQVFGEIEDEHDLKLPYPVRDTPVFELDGTVTIRDLQNQYGIGLPGDAGFETLAGFLLFLLARIPKEGEFVDYNGRRYTIQSMDRDRIATVRVERLNESTAF